MTEEGPRRDSGRAAETARSAVLLRDLIASDALLRDAVARWTGLNATDLRTVEALLRDGPLTPGELADRVGVTSGGAVTMLIDRLQKAGLVTRRRHPKDRRKVVVSARAEVARERVGDLGRVGERWAAYLDTLTEDELAFANELFTEAATANREAAAELDAFTTGAAAPSSPPPAGARRAPGGAGGARGGRPPTPR